MKKLLVLFITIALVACKKEPGYGPLNLKNGQEVELIVDHRMEADQDQLLKFPENIPAGASLGGFAEREPGYTYRIKARFHHENDPPQDGPSYYFEFEKVISKTAYKGDEPFEVQLIRSYIPGGPNIWLNKTGDNYYLLSDKLQLTYTNATVQNQLEEIWLNAQEIRSNPKIRQEPKWKGIKATVVHDPQKFGKAYLVQQIQFVN